MKGFIKSSNQPIKSPGAKKVKKKKKDPKEENGPKYHSLERHKKHDKFENEID